VEIAAPEPSGSNFVYVKHGTNGDARLVFVFLPAGCDEVRLRLEESKFGVGGA